MPSAPAAIVEALADGRIPVVAPLASARRVRSTSTPTRPQPRSRSGSARSGSCSSRTSRACLMEGAVVEHIAVDDADRMLGAGTFEGGIVPKLEAAVRAARGGVRAAIGATEVVA